MKTETTTNRPGILSLLWAIRDAQSTKGAQRQLLNALALRCSEKRKYSCWPSYSQLADDCQLDEVTLKRAAAKLEAADLIKRVVRQNRANIWFLNVNLILQQASESREAAKGLDDKEDFTSPFGDPIIIPADEAGNVESTEWNVGGTL